jgi:hypothetical protein
LLAADALMTEAERASYTDILAEAQHDIVDLQGALAN